MDLFQISHVLQKKQEKKYNVGDLPANQITIVTQMWMNNSLQTGLSITNMLLQVYSLLPRASLPHHLCIV